MLTGILYGLGSNRGNGGLWDDLWIGDTILGGRDLAEPLGDVLIPLPKVGNNFFFKLAKTTRGHGLTLLAVEGLFDLDLDAGLRVLQACVAGKAIWLIFLVLTGRGRRNRAGSSLELRNGDELPEAVILCMEMSGQGLNFWN